MPPHATFSVPDHPSLYQSNKTFSPATGSIYPHLILLVSLPVALASPRFPGRILFFSVAIVTLAVSCHIDAHFTNDIGLAQPFSQLWAVWLSALEKLFVARISTGITGKRVLGPESLFWKRTRPSREAEGMAGFGVSKIFWALAIVLNPRGANWNYRAKNVPELSVREKQGRLQFVISRAWKTIYTFIMADIANQLWMQLFFVGNTGSGYTIIGDVNSKYLTVRDPDWIWRLVKLVAWGPLPYYSISFQYNMMSMITVALKIFDPEDWPPMFGRIFEVLTVRDFWGKFWHQMIRRGFNAFTGSVVDIFRIPRGTVWSSQVQIWLSFLLSAGFHAQCHLILPAPSNITFEERTVPITLFFLWQAFAISLEDLVQAVSKPMLSKLGTKRMDNLATMKVLIGWMWVLTSFWISIPWAADLTLRFRFGDELMVPFSVAKPLTDWIFYVLRA